MRSAVAGGIAGGGGGLLKRGQAAKDEERALNKNRKIDVNKSIR
jgi:hypothetical protein